MLTCSSRMLLLNCSFFHRSLTWPLKVLGHVPCRPDIASSSLTQAERASELASAQEQPQQQQQHEPPPGLLAVRIYTASYGGVLEKAAFQGVVSRESSVFSDLIRAKQHLVLPLDMGHSSLQQVRHRGMLLYTCRLPAVGATQSSAAPAASPSSAQVKPGAK